MIPDISGKKTNIFDFVSIAQPKLKACNFTPNPEITFIWFSVLIPLNIHYMIKCFQPY